MLDGEVSKLRITISVELNEKSAVGDNRKSSKHVRSRKLARIGSDLGKWGKFEATLGAEQSQFEVNMARQHAGFDLIDLLERSKEIME